MGKASLKSENLVYHFVFVLSVLVSLIHLYYPIFGIWKTNRIIHHMFFSDRFSDQTIEK